jgi:hypothetical protein
MAWIEQWKMQVTGNPHKGGFYASSVLLDGHRFFDLRFAYPDGRGGLKNTKQGVKLDQDEAVLLGNVVARFVGVRPSLPRPVAAAPLRRLAGPLSGQPGPEWYT